jgi:hypothetical protein
MLQASRSMVRLPVKPLHSSLYLILPLSRCSALSIATDYGLDDRGGRSSSPGRIKNILFSISFRPALGPTQTPIQRVPGGPFPRGAQRQRREADHCPPTSVEVKKTWIYTLTPPYAIRLHGAVLKQLTTGTFSPFTLPNVSRRTMVLGFTQPLT